MSVFGILVILCALVSVEAACWTAVEECSCRYRPELVTCSYADLTRLPRFIMPNPFTMYAFPGNMIWSIDDSQIGLLGTKARILDLRYQKLARCVLDMLSLPTRIKILGLCPRKITDPPTSATPPTPAPMTTPVPTNMSLTTGAPTDPTDPPVTTEEAATTEEATTTEEAATTPDGSTLAPETATIIAFTAKDVNTPFTDFAATTENGSTPRPSLTPATTHVGRVWKSLLAIILSTVFTGIMVVVIAILLARRAVQRGWIQRYRNRYNLWQKQRELNSWMRANHPEEFDLPSTSTEMEPLHASTASLHRSKAWSDGVVKAKVSPPPSPPQASLPGRGFMATFGRRSGVTQRGSKQRLGSPSISNPLFNPDIILPPPDFCNDLVDFHSAPATTLFPKVLRTVQPPTPLPAFVNLPPPMIPSLQPLIAIKEEPSTTASHTPLKGSVPKMAYSPPLTRAKAVQWKTPLTTSLATLATETPPQTGMLTRSQARKLGVKVTESSL